jgi:hypothetical protein
MAMAWWLARKLTPVVVVVAAVVAAEEVGTFYPYKPWRHVAQVAAVAEVNRK